MKFLLDRVKQAGATNFRSALFIVFATIFVVGATLPPTPSNAITNAGGPKVASSANIGDLAVNVNDSSLYKLSAGSGAIIWGPVARGNCGGLAVDQVDLGVYTAGSANCTGGGAGAVYKYNASGALAWSASYAGCGVSGNYYIGNGGIAVDTTSANPGVVLAKTGYYGDIGKVSRTDGSTLFCDGTNDLGRPTIDPSNGLIYDITNCCNYNTLYIAVADGSATSPRSSCDGFTDLNPADGMLYRGGSGCGTTLSQLNKSNLATPNWSKDLSASISSIDALAVQPWSGGYIYVASSGDSKIVVVDPATQTVVRSFSTAIGADQIAVNPYGGNLYISSGGSHFVYAYSPTGSLVWTSSDLGGPVYNIATPRDVVGSPSEAPFALVINPGSAAIRTGSEGFTLGTRFTVGSQNQTVSALGVWDGPNPSGSIGDGLQAAKKVAIWDTSNGHIVAKATVPAGTGGILVGQFRYIDINPVTLLATHQYILGAYYPTNDPDQVRDQAGGPTMSSDFNTYAAAYTGSNTAGDISEPDGFTGGTAYVGPSFLYGGECDPPPSGLVGWWPGDGNTKDIQNGNTGQLKNGATFGTGEVGQAFKFDGVNDYVLV